MAIYFVRKVQTNDYVNSYPAGQMGWIGREQVTAELPNLDMLPARVNQLKPGHWLPVNTGRAGETAGYILADSQDEAIKWADKYLT